VSASGSKPDPAATLRAPWWLPGGHAQTIWAARAASIDHRAATVAAYRRERWDTPDGDFVDVDSIDTVDADAPRLVLFHGLEGSSSSHYALAFGAVARRLGWHYAVPHFRGCSGEINRAPRAYHSGDFEEIGWMLVRLRARSTSPLLAVGVSLGGNALLRWLQEHGSQASRTVAAAAAVCAPIDLTAAGAAIGRGFNRLVYTPMFLRTMKPRALAKLEQHPGLFDRDRVIAARTIHDFDDAFTAPLHGYAGVADYWRRASSKPHLADVRVPTLLLHALNDSFVPAASLPSACEVGAHVTLCRPRTGGHVGFPTGAPFAHVMALPSAVTAWLAEVAGSGR
jgi:uncharacterized protein